MDMKHRNVLFRFGRITCIVHPRIDLICQRVAFQMKNLYNSVPYRLPFENFFDGDTFAMGGFPAV